MLSLKDIKREIEIKVNIIDKFCFQNQQLKSVIPGGQAKKITCLLGVLFLVGFNLGPLAYVIFLYSYIINIIHKTLNRFKNLFNTKSFKNMEYS